MYEQYLVDPAAVSESWQDFFQDYRRDGSPTVSGAPPAGAGPTTGTAAAAPPARARPPAPPKAPEDGTAEVEGEPLRGAAALTAANMTRSLEVPTATSFREVPAKLLEVNRKIINGYLGRTRGGKLSFTHLIGFAVVRAITETMPAMNASFVEGPD